MKKIKVSIMTLAIAFSIGGAFATSPTAQSCQGAPQYFYNGSYVPAGKIGVDYLCETSAQVCTYYKVGTIYVPCMNGVYCTANCKTTSTPPKTKN